MSNPELETARKGVLAWIVAHPQTALIIALVVALAAVVLF